MQSVEIIKNHANYKGLTSASASDLLKRYGPNARPAVKQKGWFPRLWGIFSEPMMALIIFGAGIYFFMGDKHESIILLASIIPIGLMEFFQESRTDNAIKMLDKMMVEFCQVWRDGKIQKIEAKYLVPGDLVYLTAGDKISADGYLLSSSGLSIDESVLTGESMSVTKSQLSREEAETKEEHKLAQGTLVVQGDGNMLVESTGVNTRYGQLGNLLQKIVASKTPLQQKINHLVKQVAMVAMIVAVGVALILSWTHGWTHGLLGGVTIAMSLIPEEFPVVFSVFLILGVLRLAKQKSLVREMAMVETLGAAQVICSDKTGTLTEGRMSIVSIFYQGKNYSAEEITKNKKEKFTDFFTGAMLALEQVAVDPIEVEVQRFAAAIGLDKKEIYDGRFLVKDSSFNSKTKMVHHLWRDPDGQNFQYTVGAPESVIGECILSENDKKGLLEKMDSSAREGLRVIAVAKKSTGKSEEISMGNMEFVGLIVMSDPPRAGVKEAIATCQRAGIRVVMITGDNKLTAHNIAESIGMDHNEEIFSAEEIEKMSPEALAVAAQTHNIFARVRPEQKYSIVEALQSKGEVVAMTGDGVNDAPALKKANIGIAMGKRGTEVARAAAGIVLLDDNFSTIVNAVREGRRIYDNMRQAFSFLFSFHIPIVGLAVLPLLSGQPLVFSPIHIIFLELICDPTSVLGFEREHARRGLMETPPHSPNEPLIDGKTWRVILLRGFAILFVALAFYYYGLKIGGADLARTLSFCSLIISQIFLIIFSREWIQIKSNRLLLTIVAISFILVHMIIYVPFIRSIFQFVPLSSSSYIYLFAAPLIAMGMVGFFSVHLKKKN